MTNVVALVPEELQVASDLRKVVELLESGELKATTSVLVLQNRIGQMITVKTGGDTLTYSGLIGLLAYGQQMLYQEATGG